MKSKRSMILAAIQGLAALCVIGAVKIWAPVCDKMLTLTTGKDTFMKCHYTGQAALAIAVILLATAIVSLCAKHDVKLFQVVFIVSGVMLFMLFTSLIGICANPEMPCNLTALWGKGAAIVTIIAAVVTLLSGKSGQIPN